MIMLLQGTRDDFLPSRDPYSLSKCLGSLGSPGGGFCRLPDRPLLYSLKRIKVFVLSQQFSLFLNCGEIYQVISRYPPGLPRSTTHSLRLAGPLEGRFQQRNLDKIVLLLFLLSLPFKGTDRPLNKQRGCNPCLSTPDLIYTAWPHLAGFLNWLTEQAYISNLNQTMQPLKRFQTAVKLHTISHTSCQRTK